MQCKKFVVIGPESTGKSTLCEGLAAHYGTEWVREYAREYLDLHGMDYTFGDLLTIARGQLAGEDEGVRRVCARLDERAAEGRAAATLQRGDGGAGDEGERAAGRLQREDEKGKAGVLFIDTDMYVMKVWGEFVFGACDTWILDQIVERKYDGYLLCNIDLPWSFDKLREYPDEGPRQKLFEIYKDLLINQDVPWAIISGQAEERLQAAIAAVDKMLGRG